MLPAYNDCPRRAIARQFRRDIEKEGYKLNDELPSIGASVGTATHKVIENYFKSKIEERNFVVFEAVENSIIEMQENIKNGCLWDDTTPSVDTARLQVYNMSKAYIEAVGKYIKPLAVEVSLEAIIDDEWKITGHIDLVSEGFEGINLHDLKTGALVRSYHSQVGGYSLLYRSVYSDAKISNLVIDFVKRVGKSKTQEIPVSTNYDVKLCERVAYSTIMRIIFDIANFEKTKDPFCLAENPMSMLCNKSYCIAYNTDFCPITKNLNK